MSIKEVQGSFNTMDANNKNQQNFPSSDQN